MEKTGTTVALDIVSCVGGYIFKELGSSIASASADMAFGWVLSQFGYVSEQHEFQSHTQEQLKEIDTKINQILNQITDFLNHFDVQIDAIKNRLDIMEQDILREIEKAELGSRMTTINQYDTKIEYLYNKYITIINETNAKARTFYSKKLIKEIEQANIPEMLYYINSELLSNSAGSKTPILDLLNQYLKKLLPFAHQTIPYVYYFSNYMESIQIKGILLFIEYCNSQCRIDQNYSSMAKIEYDNLAKRLNLQHSKLPKKENADLITAYDKQNKPLEYQLISNYNQSRLRFSVNLINNSSYVAYEEDDFGPDYYFSDEFAHLEEEAFHAFFKTKLYYDPTLCNLDFINKHTGAGISATTWSCQTGAYTKFIGGRLRTYDYAPCININNLSPYQVPPGDRDGKTVLAW